MKTSESNNTANGSTISPVKVTRQRKDNVNLSVSNEEREELINLILRTNSIRKSA